MGAASTLKWAGPSVLLAYIIAGLFVFFIMRSMGEMLFLEPVTGSFAVYAHRYMSPFFGYLTAWSYWFMWMAVGISEITAIGVYVQFWFPEMAQWIPALIAVGLVALANLAAVRLYGEIEFWFAMIKVTTIIVMIVVGLGVIFFGFGNGGHSIGFGNLTEHGGFFAGGWKGFLTALCIVVASYQGWSSSALPQVKRKTPGDAAQRGGQSAVADPDFLRRRDFRYRHYLPVGSNRLQWQPVRTDVCQNRYYRGGGNYQLRGADGSAFRLQQRNVQLRTYAVRLAKNRQLPAAIGRYRATAFRPSVWRCRF